MISVPSNEVVITGVGILSPIGTGRDRFWSALMEGRSGVRPIAQFDASSLPVQIGAEVQGFDPHDYVLKRKSIKLMSREAQLGVAAAALACRDARIDAGKIDPSRFGVVLGADHSSFDLGQCQAPYRSCLVGNEFDFSRWGTEGLAASFPLLFLKALPNMIASHIAITQDARGPNNTIHQAEVSPLLALGEAMRTIQRGAADAMIVGAASAQLTPHDCIRRSVLGMLSLRRDDPALVMRPFDAGRDGQVWGEGAAAFILESRAHAHARGATVLARILGCANVGGPHAGRNGAPWTGLQRAMLLALQRAGIAPQDLGHVNAHGLSTLRDDALEARALCEALPAVPVFAPKSYFGNLGAAGGAVEMAASVLALGADIVPATLNYEHPDPAGPRPAVRREPFRAAASTAMLINWTWIGQAAAAVIAGPS